jgi:hypothetical protein
MLTAQAAQCSDSALGAARKTEIYTPVENRTPVMQPVESRYTCLHKTLI